MYGGAPALAALYGKTTAQGDFVRINVGDPSAQALVQWLGDGSDALAASDVRLSDEPVYFVLRGAGAAHACVGVFAPGRDSVGRVFPTALFTLLEAAALAQAFSAVPTVFAGFFARAVATLEACATLPASDVAIALGALAPPRPEDWVSAGATCRRTLGGTLAGEMLGRLFGEPGDKRRYYACRTFAEACQRVRGKMPAKTTVTLQCPIATDVDLFAWLEATQRALGWTDGPPSFFWTEGAAPQLLLPLGPPLAATMLSIARPAAVGSARLWPLWTDRADAAADAERALSPAVRRTLDAPDATLEELVGALAQP